MMKSKKEYFLLAGIIIVLILYLAFHNTNRTHYALPELAPLKGETISSLTITTPNKTIELSKDTDQWVIKPDNYKALKSKISPMIGAIEDLKVTAMVSDTENFARYDLDPKHRITISAESEGKMVRTFEIGKSAPTNQHTFIKLPDDHRVYHARGNLRHKFDQTIEELRDKTVLTFEPDQVNRIEIRKAGVERIFTIVQKTEMEAAGSETADASAMENSGSSEGSDDASKEKSEAEPKTAWIDQEGNPLNNSDVDSFLGTLSALRCEKFIYDKTKEDFTDPLFTVNIQAGSESDLVLSIFAKPEKDISGYPVVSSQNDGPFLLSIYRAENIMEKFIPKPEDDSNEEAETGSES